MIQQPDYSKSYWIKIAIVVLAAVIAELVIWWAMVREESVDWIGTQVLHQPYAYAITEIDDGRIVVGNVVKGFEVTLPAGLEVVRSKNPTFLFKQETGEVICQIKSNITHYGKHMDVSELQSEQDKPFTRIYAGNKMAIKSEQISDQEEFIYELKIPIDSSAVEYTMSSSQENKNKCRGFFEKIRMSFIYYE